VAAVAVVDETESTDSGLLTPVLALAGSRFFVPVLGAVALLAALGAIEITKRPRRAVAKGVS
jgi:hypothetical protein